MASSTEENELNLTQMWEQAQIRFEQKTRKSLKRTQIRNLDEAIELLNQKLEVQDSETKSKWHHIKTSAINVLKFIELLGGIAAQGASMVFGPVTMCFNAIQFLMDIPAKISKFYDDIGQLFEEISNFRMQFKIFHRMEQFTKIDLSLRKCTHQIMIAFVDICAISIDYLNPSKLKQFFTATKIALFDDDSGIHVKLEEFRRLIEYQSRISDGLTLESALKSEMGIEQLRESSKISRQLIEENSEQLRATHDDVKDVKEVVTKEAKERSSMNEHAEQIKRIRDKLDIALDRDSDPEREFKQIRSDRLPDTGVWLKEIDQYRHWIDLDSNAHVLLLLSGSNGSGKSNLLSAIIDEQRSVYSNREAGPKRVVISCFGFERKDKSAREGKNARQSILALKLMATQIASQDIVYAKFLSMHLKNKGISFSQEMTANDLIQELFLPPKMDSKPDMAYMLLLDGLDQLVPEEASQLINALSSLKASNFRVAVTVTNTNTESLKVSQDELDSIPTIRVEDHNESDINRYIENKLKAYEDLNSEDPSILSIVNHVRDELPRVASGNFDNVQQIIAKVQKAVSNDEDITAIQGLVSKDQLENKELAAERIVEELNESLNPQEIEQLNELLIWTVYGLEYMSVDEMRAALLLRTKKVPLQKLENKVREKYAKIVEVRRRLRDGQDAIYMRNDEIADFLQRTRRSNKGKESNVESDSKISMTISFENVKLSQARKFVWKLNEKMTFDGLDFNTPNNEEETRTTIDANPADAHLTLTRRCLAILLDNQKNDALGWYAILYLPDHLQELRKQVDISLEEKIEIVDDLISVLQSPDRIDRDLSDEYLESRAWHDVDVFHAWLTDSEATKTLKRRDRDWLSSVVSGNRMLILETIATMIARHWLCRTTWSPGDVYEWINEFLDRAQANDNQPQGPENGRSGEATNNSSEIFRGVKTEDAESDSSRKSSGEKESLNPTERIQRALKWAEQKLDIAGKNSLWYERVGGTYLSAGNYDLSKESFLKAKSLPNPSWRTFEGLAKAHAESDKVLAFHEMEIALATLGAKLELTKDERASLVGNLRTTAAWHCDLGNNVDAIHKLREAIKFDSRDYQSHDELLRLYLRTEAQPEALDFLKHLNNQPGSVDGLTELASMFLEFSSWYRPLDFFTAIFEAVQNDDWSSVVLDTLENTLQVLQKRKANDDFVNLLLCHGVALARYGTVQKGLETAVLQWTECYKAGLKSADRNAAESGRQAVEFIFNYHFTNARAALDAKDEFQMHSARLEDLVNDINTLFKDNSFGSFLNVDGLRFPHSSFCRLAGDKEKAKTLLLDQMKSGLDLLSDDDPENDSWGYSRVANVLAHAGDDLNALSAWSLMGPSERYTKEGGATKEHSASEAGEPPANAGNHSDGLLAREHAEAEFSGHSCDGQCEAFLTWSASLWFCKVCRDVQFEDSCFTKLQNGTLARFVCSADHEFIRVPSWRDEFRATGKDHVRVGGEFINGQRVGGEIVHVDTWLDSIREQWSIEKPAKEIF
ncbi:MAG: hypothetical protein M1821_005849 [Bathelium mastoideum]|nr:MAG: hypothetical protein M1821_005849 [Bathelium mastoideum]